MVKGRILLIFLTLLCCSSLVCAKERRGGKQLFSPAVGKKFYELAYEVAYKIDHESQIDQDGQAKPTTDDIDQVILFLMATSKLDERSKYILPETIKLASQHSQKDYSQMVMQLVGQYIDEGADLEVIKNAIQYLLEKRNIRELREQLLAQLSLDLTGKNASFDSELATLRGLLKAETANIKAAQSLFAEAYSTNKFNRLAFNKLLEIMPDPIDPDIYIEHLRWSLAENPLSMDDALGFAEYAQQLQLFETAAEAYDYCAKLFKYLYPGEPLGPGIYIPWTMNNYYTQRNQYKCLQIAEDVRKQGYFDLLVETVAAKAAMKSGDVDLAKRLLKQTEDKALSLINKKDAHADNGVNIGAEQMAWFYSFASPEANKALDWANKAYSRDPNSYSAGALLAYSLMLNGQVDLAKTITDSYEPTPVLDLALALVELAQGQRDTAFAILKSIISNNPGSLVAEKAKEVLMSNGGDYISPVDPDIALSLIRDSFRHRIVPEFITPERILSVQLNVQGSSFNYGREFGGSLSIKNISSRQFVISDYAMFRGNIRVDAKVTGDLDEMVPNLISIKIRPSQPIEPGKSVIVPLNLFAAKLRRILMRHPQASLNIEFTAYIDPVITAEGKVSNRLAAIAPATIKVTRPAAEITGKFLQNRVNSLSKSKQSRVRTLQLFIGLLLEQQAMSQSELSYNFKYADWMPQLLKSGLTYGLAESDWAAKVQIMASMQSLPLDYELTQAVAQNLDDQYWPVRMMTIYLLSKNSDDNFDRVLDWTAKYDLNQLVREMAISLGGERPPEKKPRYVPKPADPNQQHEDSNSLSEDANSSGI